MLRLGLLDPRTLPLGLHAGTGQLPAESLELSRAGGHDPLVGREAFQDFVVET